MDGYVADLPQRQARAEAHLIDQPETLRIPTEEELAQASYEKLQDLAGTKKKLSKAALMEMARHPELRPAPRLPRLPTSERDLHQASEDYLKMQHLAGTKRKLSRQQLEQIIALKGERGEPLGICTPSSRLPKSKYKSKSKPLPRPPAPRQATPTSEEGGAGGVEVEVEGAHVSFSNEIGEESDEALALAPDMRVTRFQGLGSVHEDDLLPDQPTEEVVASPEGGRVLGKGDRVSVYFSEGQAGWYAGSVVDTHLWTNEVCVRFDDGAPLPCPLEMQYASVSNSLLTRGSSSGRRHALV